VRVVRRCNPGRSPPAGWATPRTRVKGVIIICELTLHEGADQVTRSERVGAVPRLLTLPDYDWLGDEGGFLLTGAVVWSRDSVGPTELEFPTQVSNGADIPVSGGDPVPSSPTAVPEPRAIVLLGTAAAGLLLSRSVRRKVRPAA
jgi:hypothetical protein